MFPFEQFIPSHEAMIGWGEGSGRRLFRTPLDEREPWDRRNPRVVLPLLDPMSGSMGSGIRRGDPGEVDVSAAWPAMPTSMDAH